MTEKPCLHCYIWDAIDKYCGDTDSLHDDGQVIRDEIEILQAISNIASEVIATHASAKIRKNRIAALTSGIEAQVLDRRRAGNHSTKIISVQ